MELVLIISGILLLIVGLVGAVLPIPGPPVSFAGLLCLHFSDKIEYSGSALWIFGLLAGAMFVLDYYSPVYFAKRFGGSKYGQWGTVIGLIVGLIWLGPFFILGPFFGAFIGEVIGGLKPEKALKPAFGSFIGFLAGMFGKIILGLAMIIFAIVEYI
jgi:uncharacterized protein YqgC (DUF456 family)